MHGIPPFRRKEHDMNISSRILLAAALAAGAGLPAAFAGDLSQAPDVVRTSIASPGHHRGNVRLSFSEGHRHASLANVKLDVYDARGRDVYSQANAGPRADLHLAPGHYRVVAQADGMKRSTHVNVRPGQSTSVAMHWPRAA
jgi:hypothetical protein